MIDNNRLEQLAIEAAKRQGYEGKIIVQFLSLSTLKVRWTRGYDWVDLSVSHYLQDAPEELVSEVLDNVLGMIVGKTSTPNSEALQSWVEANRHRWAPQEAN